jgi:hypothetical protein
MDGFGRSAHTLAVAVRHAQDLSVENRDPGAPFEVTVSVASGPPTGTADAGHVVTVSSGVLVVGDAEWSEEFHVCPGCYRVAVRVEPRDAPERVTLWVEPA